MRRTLPVVLVVIALIAALVIWRSHGEPSGSTEPGGGPGATSGPPHPVGPRSGPRISPTKLPRGSIAGTITTSQGAPIARAQVCASTYANELPDELVREPTCSESRADGSYQLGNLLVASYVVSAAARQHVPAIHHPGGDRDRREIRLGAGEHRTGVDVVLHPGGVEITGVVSDITGGPIANARVWAREHVLGDPRTPIVATETDAQGAFALWVQPGHTLVVASADGYTDAADGLQAPGRLVLLLTPESTLSGVVVDAATDAPVEGVRVAANTLGVTFSLSTASFSDEEGDAAITDASGAFRIARLTPQRYVAVARGAGGYGRSEGSILVGLGQHVDKVVVKMYPAHAIEGRISIAGTSDACEGGGVWLRDRASERRYELRPGSDATLRAEGVLAGTYEVQVRCAGHLVRDEYAEITVGDRDLTGLVWEVEAGATLRGRVLTAGGDPVEHAQIHAGLIGEVGIGDATSDQLGRYVVTGLAPGTYRVTVGSPRGLGPRDGVEVSVGALATVERDLTIAIGGAIHGTVVDADGRPVAAVGVSAVDSEGVRTEAMTDAAGAFAIRPLRAGDYRVLARRSGVGELRRPGSKDGARQGEQVTVVDGPPATARLVVENQSGVIAGTVVDANGNRVADAFVSSAREADDASGGESVANKTRYPGWAQRAVVTSTEGAFSIGDLSPGRYTLRAYRRGGGEGIVEHVAVGSTARLQIEATGSIAGTVRGVDDVPDELTVILRGNAAGYRRREQFFRTGGRFVLRDLPAGRFTLELAAPGQSRELDVELARGEAKMGLDIVLETWVTIAGRVIDGSTGQPLQDVVVSARHPGDDEVLAVHAATDQAGRFRLQNLHSGELRLSGSKAGELYAPLSIVRTIAGKGTIDVGDLAMPRRRE
ncbi:MAG: hypothetical protein H6Q90_891 [Deltaproteobacteria bacterium]|nr:hypothetical protein [Deltaproteobacteria bacterium]